MFNTDILSICDYDEFTQHNIETKNFTNMTDCVIINFKDKSFEFYHYLDGFMSWYDSDFSSKELIIHGWYHIHTKDAKFYISKNFPHKLKQGIELAWNRFWKQNLINVYLYEKEYNYLSEINTCVDNDNTLFVKEFIKKIIDNN
jgi:hypothetical protein